MGKMQVLVILTLVLIVFFLFPLPAFAHPGNTASDGCHYCWTNCDSWGEVYGERHCHGGGSYDYNYPSTPSCPLFSSYNSISGNCECYSGYIASGGQCISQTEACRDQLGLNSRYNSLTDNCECSYGYVLDSSGQCTYGSTVCQNKYGFSSTYDSLSNSCECSYGYKFNLSGTKCISDDEVCQEQFGFNSKATISGDKCECKYGYIWEGNTCVWDTSSFDAPININYSLPDIFTPTPTIVPTPKPTASPTNPPTSTPEIQGVSTKNSPEPTPETLVASDSDTAGIFVGVSIFIIGTYFGLKWLGRKAGSVS